MLRPNVVEAAARLGREDWRARRTLHLLSDTFDPAPWVMLAFAARTGQSLAEVTLAQLAAMPIASFAGALPEDAAFDRAIVADALRAMCLDNASVDGSLRTRSRIPDAPITIDGGWVTTEARGIDTVAPRYWLPPNVCARLDTKIEMRLVTLDAIEDTAAAICAR